MVIYNVIEFSGNTATIAQLLIESLMIGSSQFIQIC